MLGTGGSWDAFRGQISVEHAVYTLYCLPGG